MPASKEYRNYGQAWHELFVWFEDHISEDFIMECDTEQRANSARFDFYKVRSALARDEGSDKAFPNTFKRKALIDGKKVIFKFADTLPVAELVRKSLQEAEKNDSPR